VPAAPPPEPPARPVPDPPVPVEEQLRILTAGAAQVVSVDELRERLAAGRPLRVKLGIDPTASDIHLGFAVVLRKLRQFQDLGHRAVLIIGGFTAQVGDPSGRSATRPQLSAEEVAAHAASYLEQVSHILDPDPQRLEIRNNADWLGAMGIADVLKLASRTTVARMLERDDFSKRYQSGQPISVLELLYPLLQGWDSVMVRADVELGGTDQLFNNLVGRDLQRDEGQPPQIVLTTPLLEGTDGVKKMSKSLGNYIGVAEPPAEQFGKLMRIPDSLLERYLLLTTGWHPDRVESVTADLRAGALHPNAGKRLLARTVVDLYHGDGAGAAAEAGFDQVFKAHGVPDDIEDFALTPDLVHDGRVRLARLLAAAGLVTSNKEGGRKIAEGAVRLDGEKVTDPEVTCTPEELDGRVVQVGRRAWARIVVS
jgi:tyrosyl-tRNA synthetase